jgi:hypothetical protein
MNWVVSPRKVSAAVAGVIVIYGVPEPEPEPDATTVISELAVTPPDCALIVV